MSFDIYIETPVCAHCGQGGGSSWQFNITHNVNEIVDRCLVAGGAKEAKRPDSGYHDRSWGRLDGWTVKAVLPIVEFALTVANSPEREKEFRALEPANGWGTLDSVRQVMREFRDGLRLHGDSCVIRTNG